VDHSVDDPFPEYLEVKVLSLLASLVQDRILERLLVVDISLEHESEETQPGCPEDVVEHGEPVSEVDLPREAIVECEV
jgi:hypothetical protein